MVMRNLASLRLVGARTIIGTDAGGTNLRDMSGSVARPTSRYDRLNSFLQALDFADSKDTAMASWSCKKQGTQPGKLFKALQM